MVKRDVLNIDAAAVAVGIEQTIREQVRSRAADPLPHIRFGKYVRFRWGIPELDGWAERRIIDASNRKAGRILGKETQ